MTARIARCCCGDCSIAVEGEPVLNALCHCISCRRRSGSAFGWASYFPDDKVVAKEGAFAVHAQDGAMGYSRHFCARGGTTRYGKSFVFLPDAPGIAGGCFVDAPLPAPNLSAQDTDRCA